MTIRIENNTVKENVTTPIQNQAQSEQGSGVNTNGVKTNEEKTNDVNIPIVNNEETKTDTEKPVDGYYIEKSAQDPEDDDDTFDTNVDPDARITLNPSIAIYKETNEITDAMQRSVDRATSSLYDNSGEDAYYKANNLIKNKQAYNCFNDIDYVKRFNIYGKTVYERSDATYITGVPAKIKKLENSLKTDIGINYKSKSEKTRAMLFSSLTKTNTKTDYVTNISTDNESETEESSVFNANYKSFSLFGALQQKFNNKDIGTLSAFHINDETEFAKTTEIDASYYMNKFMAMIEGNANIYKVVNQKTVTKINFNISFNPDIDATARKQTDETSDSAAEEKTEQTQTKQITESNTKKWSKSFSPFFDTQSINGATENGIGGQLLLKRKEKDSTLRVGAFGKFSTTNHEENNQYHITFGSGIKYAKSLNSKSQLKANFNIKDRTTFGHGNITTADTTVGYTTPKITAELEGKYINITHSDSPNYAGIVGRVFWIPNKNFNFFAEGSYTNMKYSEEGDSYFDLSGSNLQTGVIVNF